MAENRGQLAIGRGRRRSIAVEPGCAGYVNRLWLLTELAKPLGRVLRCDAVHVGELRHGMTYAFVDCSFGHLAAMKMNDWYTQQHSRHHDPGEFPSIAQNDQDVGTLGQKRRDAFGDPR